MSILSYSGYAEGEGEEQVQSVVLRPTSPAGFSISTITSGMSVGAGMGTFIPYGDLSPYKFFPQPKYFKSHLQYGYGFYVERDIKWGLGARLEFQKGKLKGQRRTDIGQTGTMFGFKTDLMTFSLQVRYDFTDLLFGKDLDNTRRYYVKSLVGCGMIFYRSYSFYDNNYKWVYDSYGYETEEVVATSTSAKYLVGKDKKMLKAYIPVTFQVGYRLNYKTDVRVDVALNSLFNDNLDAYNRPDFTARDKYGYFGLGLTYNFNRSPEDLKKKGQSTDEEGMEINDMDVAKRRGLLGKVIQKKELEKEADEAEMKLKDSDIDIQKIKNE